MFQCEVCGMVTDSGWIYQTHVEITCPPGSKKCELCGEQVKEDHQAEMYDPAKPELESVFCHYECGFAREYKIA